MFEHITNTKLSEDTGALEINFGAIPHHISQNVVNWFIQQDKNTKKSLAKQLSSTDAQFFYTVNEVPTGIITVQKQYLALKLFAAMCQELGENFLPFNNITANLESENTDVEINIRILSSMHRVRLDNYLPWDAVATINDIVKRNSNGKNIEQLLQIDSNFAERLILSPLRPVFGNFSERSISFFNGEDNLQKTLHSAMITELDYKPTFGFLKEIFKEKNKDTVVSQLDNADQKNKTPKEKIHFSENFKYAIKIPANVFLTEDCKSKDEAEKFVLSVISKNLRTRIEKEIKSKLDSYLSEIFSSKMQINSSFSKNEFKPLSDRSILACFTITPSVDIEITISDKILSFLKSVSSAEKELGQRF